MAPHPYLPCPPGRSSPGGTTHGRTQLAAKNKLRPDHHPRRSANLSNGSPTSVPAMTALSGSTTTGRSATTSISARSSTSASARTVRSRLGDGCRGSRLSRLRSVVREGRLPRQGRSKEANAGCLRHRPARRIRWPLGDGKADTRINRLNTTHPPKIREKCQDQTPPKRQRSIDAELSEMS